MNKKQVIKLISIILLAVFTIDACVYADGLAALPQHNLAAYSIFQKPTAEDLKFFAIAFAIAEHFLVRHKDRSTLATVMRDKFRNNREFLNSIDLGAIEAGEDVVSMRYGRRDGLYRVDICLQEKARSGSAARAGWVFAGERFAICAELIEEGELAVTGVSEDASGPSGQRDLRGPSAPEANPKIKNLISEGSVVEVTLEDGELKAYTVNYVNGYRPGATRPEDYRGETFDIRKLLSREEMSRLTNWLLSHEIEGEPVRFRVALGQAALGWKNDIDHSNIGHAGVRDGAIYMGGLFFRHLFQKGNEGLRDEILDRDEFRHLSGLDHGTDQQYQNRLRLVEPVIQRLEDIRKAMLDDDWKYLFGELQAGLAESNRSVSRLFGFLKAVNEVALTQPTNPVEIRYPILRAAALLDRKEQTKLIKILNKSYMRYQFATVDSILLMLDENIPKDWMEKWAPALEGRSVWQAASEIWLPAGGLGRVMQFHGIAMQKFLKTVGRRLNHIEPYYDFGKAHDGSLVPIDYPSLIGQNGRRVKLVKVAEFDVEVGCAREPRKTVAICYRGIRKDGTAVYLIKDRDGYYTKMLYSYNTAENPATWEEFSEFFSKASLKLVQVMEEGSVKKEGWKPPVVHLNDAQLALAAAYRKKYYSEDAVLGQAVIAFTTHTYPNRQIYGTNQGREVLRKFGIPELEGYFKHDYGEIIDMTSGGLRLADWTGCVSAAHGRDVEAYDKWKDERNDFTSLQLVAVTNGDQRTLTARKFRQIMLGLFPNADVEHPTPDEIMATKREAKRRLNLNPEQALVSYTGRLVREKISTERAFAEENIIKLVKSGVQVVIGTGVHRDPEIEQAFSDILSKVQDLKAKEPANYPGDFIFIRNINVEDQRAILAATDIQIQDSIKKTEAAGFSEADVCVCGGLELTPPRFPTHPDEGILQKQGVVLNPDVSGEGNTLIPEDASPASYRRILEEILIEKPKASGLTAAEYLAPYQATSVRLSRILQAKLTAAEYLRQFSYAAARKEGHVQARAQARPQGPNDVTIADIGFDAADHEGVVNPNIRALIARGHEVVRVENLDSFEIHVVGDKKDMFIDKKTGERAHAGGISTVGSKKEVRRLWIVRGYYETERQDALRHLKHEAVELKRWCRKTQELLEAHQIRGPDDITSNLPTIREWIAQNIQTALGLQEQYHREAARYFPTRRVAGDPELTALLLKLQEVHQFYAQTVESYSRKDATGYPAQRARFVRAIRETHPLFESEIRRRVGSEFLERTDPRIFDLCLDLGNLPECVIEVGYIYQAIDLVRWYGNPQEFNAEQNLLIRQETRRLLDIIWSDQGPQALEDYTERLASRVYPLKVDKFIPLNIPTEEEEFQKGMAGFSDMLQAGAVCTFQQFTIGIIQAVSPRRLRLIITEEMMHLLHYIEYQNHRLVYGFSSECIGNLYQRLRLTEAGDDFEALITAGDGADWARTRQRAFNEGRAIGSEASLKGRRQDEIIQAIKRILEEDRERAGADWPSRLLGDGLAGAIIGICGSDNDRMWAYFNLMFRDALSVDEIEAGMPPPGSATQPPQPDKSQKGSVAEGLKELYRNFRNAPVTVAQFAAARNYSWTTAKTELEMLREIGLVNRAEDTKEYTLVEQVRNLSPPKGQKLPKVVSDICNIKVQYQNSTIKPLDRYEIPPEIIPAVKKEVTHILQGLTGVAASPEQVGLQTLFLEVAILGKCDEVYRGIVAEQHLGPTHEGDVTTISWSMDPIQFAHELAMLAMQTSGGDIGLAARLAMGALDNVEHDDYGSWNEGFHTAKVIIHNDEIVSALQGTSVVADFGIGSWLEPHDMPEQYHSTYWQKIRPLMSAMASTKTAGVEQLDFVSSIAPAKFLLEVLGISLDKAVSRQSIDEFTLFSFNSPKAKLLSFRSYPVALILDKGESEEEINLVTGLGNASARDSNMYYEVLTRRVLGECLFGIFDSEERSYNSFHYINGMPHMSSVFPSTNFFTRQFIEAVRLVHIGGKSRVLELGCGSGVVACDISARTGARVDAVDINPYAVACTRALAAERGLDNVRAWQSDALNNVHDRYDAIFLNAPHITDEALSDNIAFEDVGGRFLRSVLESVPSRLTEKGSLFVMVNLRPAEMADLAGEFGLSSRDLYNIEGSDIFLYEVRPGRAKPTAKGGRGRRVAWVPLRSGGGRPRTLGTPPPPTLGVAGQQAMRAVERIHALNLDLLPPVEDGKILWHVIPAELIPTVDVGGQSLANRLMTMLNELYRQCPGLRERIRIVSNRQDVITEVKRLIDPAIDPKNVNNVVDVALTNAEGLKDLPKGVKALVFERGEGNFVQLEGVLAALRALQHPDPQYAARQLVELHRALAENRLTGTLKDIEASIANPAELAKYIKFVLRPITIHNYEDLDKLNRAMLEFIKAA